MRHREAARGKIEPFAIGADHIFARRGRAMLQPGALNDRLRCVSQFATAERVEQVAREHHDLPLSTGQSLAGEGSTRALIAPRSRFCSARRPPPFARYFAMNVLVPLDSTRKPNPVSSLSQI
jgi:hypothetical protein